VLARARAEHQDLHGRQVSGTGTDLVAYRQPVDGRAQEPAALSLRAHLRVGRLLRGWPLALVVAMRELPCAVFTAGTSLDVPAVAPSWVLIEDRGTGEQLLRLPAGRAAGAGAVLLDEVQAELRMRSRQDFLRGRAT